MGDGVREAPFDGSVTAATMDGSVWLRNHKEVAVRLGDQGRYVGISTIGPDGTPYGRTPKPSNLRGFAPSPGPALLAPDGTVWVRGTSKQEGADRRPRLARLDDEGWARIAPPDAMKGKPRRGIYSWGATADGSVYATVGGPGKKRWMYRFRDDGWEELPTPPDGVGDIRVGHDGAVWGFGDRRLARLEDGRWISHHLFDLLPALRIPEVDVFGAAVAADGALWFFVDHANGCTGPARFDGSTITLLMENYCGTVPVAAPDGNVWVTAIPYERVGAPDYSSADLGLYVITPAAVAAARE